MEKSVENNMIFYPLSSNTHFSICYERREKLDLLGEIPDWNMHEQGWHSHNPIYTLYEIYLQDCVACNLCAAYNHPIVQSIQQSPKRKSSWSSKVVPCGLVQS